MSINLKKDCIREANNKHEDVDIVTGKKKKLAEKKQIMSSTNVRESTVAVPDSYINAKKIMGEQSLSGVDDLIKRYNKVNDQHTITSEMKSKESE